MKLLDVLDKTNELTGEAELLEEMERTGALAEITVLSEATAVEWMPKTLTELLMELDNDN